MEMGAFIEYTLAAYTHTTPISKTHYYPEVEYAAIDEGMGEQTSGGIRLASEQIQTFGADNCIIGTDFGVYILPDPIEGLREFIAALMGLGTCLGDIRKLVAPTQPNYLG